MVRPFDSHLRRRERSYLGAKRGHAARGDDSRRARAGLRHERNFELEGANSMADFFQPQQQQDPDAIRKAMLLKMFGAAAGGGQPAGVPPNSMMNPTKPVNMTPTGDADPAQRPLAAKPTTQPLAEATDAAKINGRNIGSRSNT